VRADVETLYRVLRTLDDLVDEDDPRAAARVAAVEAWARSEPADSPETRALEQLHECHPFPRERLLEFCAGMRHDLARAPIADDAGFERYCQQAGGSVGVVLASLLGTVGDTCEAERLMAVLGRAMQVTNILRDIDEDRSCGRVYIPRTFIERFGFPAPGARAALLREWIPRADALYDEGAGAIPLLRYGRAAMALSAALYREILRQLERDEFGGRG
jgi:phytoene synthase